MPASLYGKVAAANNIGFGYMIKLQLGFKRRWWTRLKGRELPDLLFLMSDETVPVWWTQHPSDHPVLTGWLAGPGTNDLAQLDEPALVEAGTASLATIAGVAPAEFRQEI